MEPESLLLFVMPQVIKKVDAHIDECCAQRYKDQPLAQDWARVAKVAEEAGEAVSELIQWTGQSPRKGEHPESRAKLLAELADATVAAMCAIQHFTKDLSVTQAILISAQRKALARIQAQEPGE